MDECCEHCLEGDDENFLLDDDNASTKKCTKCRNKTNHWPNNTECDNNWTINSVLNVNGTRAMEDQIDSFEDAPLLINDCYRDSSDEFHCHSILNENEDRRAWKKLLLASFLCFFFMITELIGGFIAGSLAVMTDAAHLFSDFVGFLISLLSIWMARKSPTKTMTFGYHRAEVLGAFLSVLTIWLLAAVFAVLAINRLWKKEYDIDADTMMLVASLGVLVNVMMGAVLYGFCHEHSHGLQNNQPDGHSSNINVRAAAAHVLGDLLQSFGVLIAAIIIKLFPNAKLADPICTLIFSTVVICTTAKVARDSIWMLLEGSPKNATSAISAELQTIQSVKHIHNLHIWTLSPGKEVMSVHLCVDKYCDRELILKKATCIVRKKLNVISCTIQIESYNPELVNSCSYCMPRPC